LLPVAAIPDHTAIGAGIAAALNDGASIGGRRDRVRCFADRPFHEMDDRRRRIGVGQARVAPVGLLLSAFAGDLGVATASGCTSTEKHPDRSQTADQVPKVFGHSTLVRCDSSDLE
jgi:hypothetical protein